MARLRLDKLLVVRGFASSREEARELVEAGKVRVGGLPCTKPASLVSPDTPVEICDRRERWVSRGAHKLRKALEYWNVDPGGLHCLDIGASTGGFTQVLLRGGAASVTAVDVGYGQLAWELRNDERVVVMERTNARYLRPEDVGRAPDLVTVDASFISIRLLLPAIEALIAPGGLVIALVKPQFEVGRSKIGDGVVKDPSLHLEVLNNVARFIADKTRLVLQGATFSPIRGPEGNIEFLFLLESGGEVMREAPDFDKLVREAHEHAGEIDGVNL